MVRIVKWLVLLSVVGLVGVGSYFLLRSDKPAPNTSNDAGKSVLGSENSGNQVEVDGYVLRWFEIQDTDKLFLRENFEEKRNASEIYKNEGCEFLSSGGFYIRDNESNAHSPIGYFVTQGEKLGNYLENKTLDGVLSVNQFGVVRITRGVPSGDLRWAVQTGPILFENGSEIKISMANDKNARRVVALVDGDNKLYFAVIYLKDSVYGGPTLEEMPGLLSEFAKESKINLADAVNLDGGSASAFITKNFQLVELSPIGSYFCMIY